MDEEAKKYRKKNAGAVALAVLIGGYIGGLTALGAWMALGKGSPRPTWTVLLIFAGAGLAVILATAAWVRRKAKREDDR